MESNETVSGATDSTSGAVENNETEVETSGAGETEENAAFKRLLREKKAETDKRRALELQLKERNEKDMLDKENYKELLKSREDDLAKANATVQEYERVKKQAQVNSSLRDELLKLGADPKHMDKALKLMDRERLIVDEDTGVVIGAQEAAKAFYQSNSDLGFFSKKAPGVNHNAPSLDIADSKEAYKAELAKCKTQKEIEAVMLKYRS